MCLLDIIVYVADGEINGPIFIVSYSNEYSSLITAENDRAKDRAMGFRILGDDVLMNNENKFRIK